MGKERKQKKRDEMRKISLILICILALLIFPVSCKIQGNNDSLNIFEEFFEDLVSIRWHGDPEDGLQTFNKNH